jgi:hypothetical protein
MAMIRTVALTKLGRWNLFTRMTLASCSSTVVTILHVSCSVTEVAVDFRSWPPSSILGLRCWNQQDIFEGAAGPILWKSNLLYPW